MVCVISMKRAHRLGGYVELVAITRSQEEPARSSVRTLDRGMETV